jgi:DNA polymerase (family X)
VARSESSPPDDLAPPDENAKIAQALREMGALVEAQGGNPYRAAAYRRGADTVAALAESARALYAREGHAGLDALPGIGPRIAAAIGEMLATGHWQQLEHLRGDADPTAQLRSVPGVGAELAQRMHESLGIETLEAMEAAAHDGRLEKLPQVGARRAAAIRAALTEMLDSRRARQRSARAPLALHEPAVDMLLDVDRAYRAGARAGTLPTIAPRRFNPGSKAWLPVLHTTRGDWHFTALYSNTARAHELGRVRDWVVVYGEDAEHGERQYTVVTAQRGPLAGLRVVRGREAECRAWHQRTLAD